MGCIIYSSIKKNILSEKKIQEIILIILKKIKKRGDLSVHFISDQKMKNLNKQYRNKDKTTDVLSFANENSFFKKENDLGDIFISISQIKRQAKKYSVAEKEELLRMLVHGILHLVGYDHLSKKDSENMFKIQENIVKKIN